MSVLVEGASQKPAGAPDDAVARGYARLRVDLVTGACHARHGHLLAGDVPDIGHRSVAAQVPVGDAKTPEASDRV